MRRKTIIRWFKAISGIILIVGILYTIGCFVVSVSVDHRKLALMLRPQFFIPFDRERWHSPESFGRIRYGMACTLIREKRLIGLSQDELDKLIGPWDDSPPSGFRFISVRDIKETEFWKDPFFRALAIRYGLSTTPQVRTNDYVDCYRIARLQDVPGGPPILRELVYQDYGYWALYFHVKNGKGVSAWIDIND